MSNETDADLMRIDLVRSSLSKQSHEGIESAGPVLRTAVEANSIYESSATIDAWSNRQLQATYVFQSLPLREASPKSLYPHGYDDSTAQGQVRRLLEQALSDAQKVFDAFENIDLIGVSSGNSAMAVVLRRAYELADFNDALAAVVAYIRRAVATAPATEVTRSGLNALLVSLRQLSLNPFVDFSEAAVIAESLASEGWNGEQVDAAYIVNVLMNDEEVEASPTPGQPAKQS